MKVKIGARELTLDTRIGSGGEGDVYTSGQQNFAYKIYKHEKRTNQKQQKIQAMVDARLHQTSKVVAFPIDIVTDVAGDFIGFSMELVKGGKPVHELYNPKSRREEFPSADYRFLIRTAANIARAIGTIHSANCIIGDINHSGILVSQDATVTLIDADSFQFTQNGKIFPCEVGVADFTPPELQGRHLGNVLRKLEHDHFGLGVLVFQLLMMRHPYTGIYPDGITGIAQAIKANVFPYSRIRHSQTKAKPAPMGMTLDDMPMHIAYAFEDAFGLSPVKRPNAKTWIQLLSEFENNLSKCHLSKTHFYSSHLPKCCWCRLEGKTGLDMFPELLIEMGRGGGATHTDIRKIIQVCNSLSLPDLHSAFPKISTLNLKPSKLATAAKSSAASKKLMGVIMAIAAIGTFIAVPSLWVVAGGVGLWGFSMMGAGPDTEQLEQAYMSALKTLESTWKMALKSLGVAETYQLLDDLKEMVSNYQEIDSLETEEIQQIQSNKYLYQLNDYLSHRYIKNFKISGIGPAKTAELASWGIETAGDVEYNKIIRIPGFGPTTTRALISWRKGLETRFVPKPNDTADQRAIAQAKIKYDKLRSDYEKKISITYQSVSRAIPVFSNVERKLSAHAALKMSIQEYAQARVDIEAFGINKESFDPMSVIRTLGLTAKNYASRKKSSSINARGGQSTVASQAQMPTPRPIKPTPQQKNTASTGTGVPTCPVCGSSMVKRLARRGSNSGNYFWGCSKYPRCKGTRSI